METLGEILIEKSRISQAKLKHCLNIQKQTHEKLGEILIKNKFVEEEDVALALAKQSGWRYCSQPITNISSESLKKIDVKLCQEYSILPVVLNGDVEIALLFSDPFDTIAKELVAEKGLGNLPKLVSTKSIINLALERFALISDYSKRRIDNLIKDITSKGVSDGAAQRLVDALVEEAVRQGVSDIHIEPSDLTSDIRFRIDGMLQPVSSIKKEFHAYLVNVCYDRAGITTQEFNKYHNANFSQNCFGRRVDIRLSSLPSRQGASICLRILDRKKIIIPISQLGYESSLRKIIERIYSKPYGLMLITGPTGSGKTTTLYAILSRIRDERVKILTIEDPIEVELPLTQQSQVNLDAGITFASSIREFLRHDPDVILIGEIRDTETAQESIRAALTGHKTFSTLHTTGCLGSITRLLDLGVDLSYLGLALAGVVSQRLVRTLCPHCRQKEAVPPEYKEFFPGIKEVYQAKGCSFCHGTGYRGRTVVAEVLEITPSLRRSMLKKDFSALEQGIKRMQDKDIFRTLQKNSLHLIENGVTSIEEVERVIGLRNEI